MRSIKSPIDPSNGAISALSKTYGAISALSKTYGFASILRNCMEE
jgi:hypothetical protein